MIILTTSLASHNHTQYPHKGTIVSSICIYILFKCARLINIAKRQYALKELTNSPTTVHVTVHVRRSNLTLVLPSPNRIARLKLWTEQPKPDLNRCFLFYCWTRVLGQFWSFYSLCFMVDMIILNVSCSAKMPAPSLKT